LKIHDVRIGDDFPWYILNTFVPFTAAPAYTWEEKPVELLYNTSTERTNGISVGLKAKDQIEDLLVNQLNPATQTLLYPDGFFNNLPVNQAEIAYLDWRVNEYVPVKIVFNTRPICLYQRELTLLSRTALSTVLLSPCRPV